MHPDITKDDVKDYAARYKGSEDEQEDLLDFYEEKEGDLTHILECIIASENTDVPRFVKFYEDQIKLGVIQTTELFETSKGKISELPDEKAEAK